jgi:hypothetical protein
MCAPSPRIPFQTFAVRCGPFCWECTSQGAQQQNALQRSSKRCVVWKHGPTLGLCPSQARTVTFSTTLCSLVSATLYSFTGTIHAVDCQAHDYSVLKGQWNSILPDQARRFSAFRDREHRIEKDVVRTDRSHPFFAGTQQNCGADTVHACTFLGCLDCVVQTVVSHTLLG